MGVWVIQETGEQDGKKFCRSVVKQTREEVNEALLSIAQRLEKEGFECEVSEEGTRLYARKGPCLLKRSLMNPGHWRRIR